MLSSFKATRSFIVLLLIMLCISTSAFAGYYAIGVGDGGDAKERSVTLEVGSRNINIRGKRFFTGIGIPIFDHGDKNIPPETIGSPSPNVNYTSLGRKTEGIETGLLGKFGIKQFHPDLYFSMIGGFTRVHKIHLVQSNSTQNYYEQSSKNAFNGVFGVSVAFFPELFDWKLKLNIQLDIDNRRGVTGLIGWCW